MSSVTTIARKDFRDSLRSRSLWVITGVMTLLVLSAWITFISSSVAQQADRPFTVAVAQFSLWLPLAAIGIGFKSIVGERSSGSIRVLLGQPSTRRDVVFGTYLGRSSMLIVTVLGSLSILSVLVFVDFGHIDLSELLGGTVVLLLYALAWIGMTVGVSGFVSSESRAIGVMIGIYTLVEPLWRNLVLRLFSVAFTGNSQIPSQMTYLRSAEGPTWYIYVNRLSPSASFDAARHYVPDVIEGLFRGVPVSGPHGPNLFGLVVLLTWATVPILIGYWRFEQAELN